MRDFNQCLNIFNWTLINPVQQMILYGPRLRIDYSYHGNIGNLSLSIFSYPGNIGNLLFPISDMVEIRAAGERLQGLGSQGLGLFLEYVPGIL